ncbi:SEL1-like repeat protein [Aliamphritea hakodatensis]|uniref:SEL1-like repeat protein n=1 Tax=Aliamphritea hakodatensis TaxID=2895352 RepID=UPI0022FD6A4B|nr:SEL1-like repeat protein [Aliamphritea hakodatensis]
MRIIISTFIALLMVGCTGFGGHQDLSSEALYKRGVSYTQGTDRPQDYAAGVRDFIRAGERGHAAAQYLAGIGFYTGRGVAQDYQQARYWFTQAALQGHAAAMNQLGDIYLNGRGAAAEKSWGMYWTGRAASQGDVNAMFVYGIGRLRGLGVPEDIRQGVFWLKLAQQHGRQNMEQLLSTMQQKYPREYEQAGKDIQHWQPLSVAAAEKRMQVVYIQSRLRAEGYSPGSADGLWGTRTASALNAFCLGRQQVCDQPDNKVIELLRKAEREH